MHPSDESDDSLGCTAETILVDQVPLVFLAETDHAEEVITRGFESGIYDITHTPFLQEFCDIISTVDVFLTQVDGSAILS